jgi:hypothetical protein
MKIVLTSEEASLLWDELHDRLGTIREEIYHSDTYDFTEQLKRKERVIKELIEKIESSRRVEN